MTINPTNTVREVVTTMPDATRIFERLGIDYCCGGSRTLADACQKAGVPLDDAMRLLAEVGAASDEAPLTDWQKESLTALVNFIVDQHHEFTRHELERLDQLSHKVAAVHGKIILN